MIGCALDFGKIAEHPGQFSTPRGRFRPSGKPYLEQALRSFQKRQCCRTAALHGQEHLAELVEQTCQVVLVTGLARVVGDQLLVPVDGPFQLPGSDVRKTDQVVDPGDSVLGFGCQSTCPGPRVVAAEIENVFVIAQQIFQKCRTDWLQTESVKLALLVDPREQFIDRIPGDLE